MKTPDIKRGQVYRHAKYGKALVIGPHPHDKSYFIIELQEMHTEALYRGVTADSLYPILELIKG